MSTGILQTSDSTKKQKKLITLVSYLKDKPIMHFYEFITTLEPTQTPSKHTLYVIDLIKNDKKFPQDNSDPTVIAIRLYLRLNEKQTVAFQKLLMLYRATVPSCKFPPRSIAHNSMFLDAMNLIVQLQNNDSRYQFHSK